MILTRIKILGCVWTPSRGSSQLFGSTSYPCVLTGHDSSLSDVTRRFSDLAQENAFRRAINRVADADLIQDLNKEIDECLNNFMVCLR